jgi:hypothetical protein
MERLIYKRVLEAKERGSVPTVNYAELGLRPI